jgi:hypothetical protein
MLPSRVVVIDGAATDAGEQPIANELAHAKRIKRQLR